MTNIDGRWAASAARMRAGHHRCGLLGGRPRRVPAGQHGPAGVDRRPGL